MHKICGFRKEIAYIVRIVHTVSSIFLSEFNFRTFVIIFVGAAELNAIGL